MMDELLPRKIYPSQLGNRDDDFFMKLAFNQAVDAFNLEEVPVGAVVVLEGEVTDLNATPTNNHKLEVSKGVLAEECRAIIKAFFEKKRIEKR